MRVLHIHSGNLYGGIETLLITLSRLRERCPEMDPHYGFVLGTAFRQFFRLHEALVVTSGAGASGPRLPGRMGGMTSASSMANRANRR